MKTQPRTMSAFIRNGETFTDWWLENRALFATSKTDCQIRFAMLQDAIVPTSSEQHATEGQFIVVQLNGLPNRQDEKSTVIHSTRRDAEAHAKLSGYQYGKFKIVPYQTWKHTKPAKFLARKQYFLAKLQEIRKHKP